MYLLFFCLKQLSPLSKQDGKKPKVKPPKKKLGIADKKKKRKDRSRVMKETNKMIKYK